jgi:hypothetical protein
VEKLKLEEAMEAAGQQPDVEIEFPKKSIPRARPNSGHKRSTKLRYKS